MQNSKQKSLIVGVLNLMPSDDRMATEKMFERRFDGLPIEIVWLSPEAHKSDFADKTDKTYLVPNQKIYEGIDYLFRSGANAEFERPAENRFLECLRESYSFDKGSTSLCWSAGQIYADATKQEFPAFLMGCDGAGEPIKRSGYYEYEIEQGSGLAIPPTGYMACSRHFQIDETKQKKIIEDHGFKIIGVSKNSNDVAGVIKGNDILLFTHNEYDPERLGIETQRRIDKANNKWKKIALKAEFESTQQYEYVADEFGQKLFQAILCRAFERKHPETALAAIQQIEYTLKYA